MTQEEFEELQVADIVIDSRYEGPRVVVEAAHPGRGYNRNRTVVTLRKLCRKYRGGWQMLTNSRPGENAYPGSLQHIDDYIRDQQLELDALRTVVTNIKFNRAWTHVEV